MSTEKLTCRCGAKSKPFERQDCYNVGDRARKSEFKPILINGGGITWICKGCWKKLHVVSDVLKEIFGEDARNVYIGSLPNISKTLKKDEG